MTDSTPSLANIGVTGLATMGRNLARNLARHGHVVALHNRTQARTDALVAQFGSEGSFVPSQDLEGFVASLEPPRRILIMVKAGQPTDEVIDDLVPLLEPGDIVIDGGNAHFQDTRRRETALREHDLHFVGAGVSGGEEGALLGPSIMPGGSTESYDSLGPILESIAAVVDGTPCCTHVGTGAAGHFVKMVHNGIEYADMQLIAESYDILRSALEVDPAEIAEIFRTWNGGELESFLIEITADVLGHVDASTGRPFVDVVQDAAEQKGTGRWTVQTALELGTPVSGIAEAVFARALSGHLEQRDPAKTALPGTDEQWEMPDRKAFVEDVRRALYASKIVAYAQGFDMIRAGAAQYDWEIDLGAMATIWRGGCIIRARFLDRIREAYEDDPDLPSLVLAPYFRDAIAGGQDGWRRIVAGAARAGVPAPGFGSALAYYDGLRRERSPAALIQGMRDLFGAHTYQRINRDGAFHTQWAAEGRVEIDS